MIQHEWMTYGIYHLYHDMHYKQNLELLIHQRWSTLHLVQLMCKILPSCLYTLAHPSTRILCTGDTTFLIMKTHSWKYRKQGIPQHAHQLYVVWTVKLYLTGNIKTGWIPAEMCRRILVPVDDKHRCHHRRLLLDINLAISYLCIQFS